MSLISRFDGSGYLTIPPSAGFGRYNTEYKALVTEYSLGPPRGDMIMINPDYSDIFRSRLQMLNKKYSKVLLCREEQLQSVLN